MRGGAGEPGAWLAMGVDWTRPGERGRGRGRGEDMVEPWLEYVHNLGPGGLDALASSVLRLMLNVHRDR